MKDKTDFDTYEEYAAYLDGVIDAYCNARELLKS